MTSEILVMNKSCVAMAADSTATTYSGKGYKTFSVDKIFPLSFHQPVGVMFYNIADITGFPLDVLVKEFSKKLGREQYDTVEEYAEKFFEFINGGKIGSTSQRGGIISSAAIDKRIRILMRVLCLKIFSECDKRISEKFKEHLNSKGCTVERIINQCQKGVTLQTLSDMIKCLPSTDEQILNDAMEDLEKVIDLEKEFDIIPDEIIKRDLKKKAKDVRKILANMLLNNGFEEEYTGVVVTGYGKNEFFPSYVHYKIYGHFFGQLKYEKIGEKFSIDEERSARIEVFAQKDVAETFIFGISKEFRDSLIDGFKDALDLVTGSIVDAFGGDSKQKKKFLDENKDIMSGMTKDVADYLDEEYKNPAEAAVQFLSKDEVSSLAESLINITSMRRRVSMDPETVGGPTDVAIISRGEGFIWVKRKHYFKTELNPYYVSRRKEGEEE